MPSSLHVCLYPFPHRPSPSVLFHTDTLIHAHTHRRQAHNFFLLVTECQQEQVEGTLPHAEPSVCCCLSPYHARYTKNQYKKARKWRQTSTLQQFPDRESNSNALHKDRSQPTQQWLWSSRTIDIFAGFLSGAVTKKVFISSHDCDCLLMKRHECRSGLYLVVWNKYLKITQGSKQLHL